VVQIVSRGSKLSKTVGLLAVRLDLAELQLKNRKKRGFLTKILNLKSKTTRKKIIKNEKFGQKFDLAELRLKNFKKIVFF